MFDKKCFLQKKNDKILQLSMNQKNALLIIDCQMATLFFAQYS